MKLYFEMIMAFDESCQMSKGVSSTRILTTHFMTSLSSGLSPDIINSTGQNSMYQSMTVGNKR